MLCVPFTDGALKGHFGRVELKQPPLSVAVKVLCLQHIREVECGLIQECEVSIIVRCIVVIHVLHLLVHYIYKTYFSRPKLHFLYIDRDHLSVPVRHHPCTPMCA